MVVERIKLNDFCVMRYLPQRAIVAIGFVLTFSACITPQECSAKTPADVARVVIHADRGTETISRHIYGHFMEHIGRCVYEGLWVGEDSSVPNTRGIRNDMVEALKKIDCPNIRWPGGCFADLYHWRDGIGPRSDRPVRENLVWEVLESNEFGTHEFMDLCEQVGCEPVIVGNMGSGTVQEMHEWADYLTGDKKTAITDLRRKNGRDKPWNVKYFGVGNESWWCGGNMRPEDIATNYRRYQGYIGYNSGRKFFKIACGPNGDWTEPTEVMMRTAYQDELHIGVEMQGLALHWYCHSYENRSATDFGEKEWFETLKSAMYIKDIILKHKVIMDKYDPEKKTMLIVDEWGAGIWDNTGSHKFMMKHQNTLRDALVAGITLNTFNRQCDRVHMANLSGLANVCQELFITEGDELIITPTYYVFEMYKVHQGATLLPTDIECADCDFHESKPKFASTWGDTVPIIDVSASQDKSGKIHVSICNTQPRDSANVLCELDGFKPSSVSGRILTAAAINMLNSLEQLEAVKTVDLPEVSIKGDTVTALLPPRSVAVLEIQ